MRAFTLAVVLTQLGTAHADRVVAMAPVSVVGVDDKSAQTKKAIELVELAIAKLPDTIAIPATKVGSLVDRAKKPHLRACDGDVRCLTELGKLVGAQIVVSGEVGGLGDLQVVYFRATDVATGQDLRSTTLTVGTSDASGGPAGAAIRLLDPDKYLGALRLAIDVDGATVFVNGAKLAFTRDQALSLPVGTHALRVTHPRYRDFIRFVAVTYGQTQQIPVVMAQHPIVEHDIATGIAGSPSASAPPLYRRWYVAAPALIALSIGTGFAVAALAHHFPAADDCRVSANQACR